MRYEPLPVTPRHPFGQGPFRGKGMIFEGLRAYAAQRIPGGMDAVLAEVGDPDVKKFFDQIFLASANYDLSPLVRVVRVVARLERTPVDQFVRKSARTAAELHIGGLYRQQLKVNSPEEMATRLPRMFGRYYEPCQAEIISIEQGHLRARFTGLPTLLIGNYVWSNEGFIGRALELAGAQRPRFEWSAEQADGELEGISLRTIGFNVTWAAP